MCVTSNNPKLFAEDICIIIYDPCYQKLVHKVDLEASSVNNWMKTNKLTIDLNKSNLRICQPTQNQVTHLSIITVPTSIVHLPLKKQALQNI